MAEAGRVDPGGIRSLLTAPRELWEAIEADLLRSGWTLADVPSVVSWRAVLAMIRHAPREAATTRNIAPVASQWSQADYLLANLVDLLQLDVWFQTKNGRAGRKRPKPVRRPGEKPVKTTIGTPTDLEVVDRFLSARAANATCMHGDGRPIHADLLCLPHYRAARRKKAGAAKE